MQKHVNLVDLVKSFPTNIFLQNLASIQNRTSPIKFDHLAEKSDKGSISNLSTKAYYKESGFNSNTCPSGYTPIGNDATTCGNACAHLGIGSGSATGASRVTQTWNWNSHYAGGCGRHGGNRCL